MRAPMQRSIVVVALAIAASSCSSGGASTGAGQTTADDVEPTTDSTPDFVRNSGEVIAGSGAADDTPPGTEGEPDSTTTIATVPDTGVPGIDSDDAFCRAWSEFAGSFQALGIASAFAEPDAAARLEVIAAPAVVAAVADLGEHLPATLEAERTKLLDEFAGPFARRAARAEDELRAAGVERIDELRGIWLAQLIESGVDDPTIAVTLPDDVDAGAVDAAAAAFAAAVPRIVEDPSLVTVVEIPMTDEYLVANCPDQGILGGNDDISS